MTILRRLRLLYARRTHGTIVLLAPSGDFVRVHPDFAEAYWHDPGLWAICLEQAAEGKFE